MAVDVRFLEVVNKVADKVYNIIYTPKYPDRISISVHRDKVDEVVSMFSEDEVIEVKLPRRGVIANVKIRWRH